MVNYRNGFTKTVSTQDTAEAPKLLGRAIDMTTQISRDLATTSVG